MELLVSHVILSIVVGVAGLCAGWWLHGRIPVDRIFVGQDDEGVVRELLSGLQRVSQRVAADVDEHNTAVGAVDRELNQMRSHGSTQVVELVKRLVVANRSVQTKLQEAEGKLDELSTRIEHHASEARTDMLTGLANRRAFQEKASDLQTQFLETDQCFSLVMIDIDRFKQINDVHGHPLGDELLRGLGATLREQFRGCDFVTRYGGEEFAVLLPSMQVAEARHLAESVREAVERTRFELGGKSFNLTVSMGVAEILLRETMPDLLKRADQALYAAKRSGRNRLHWHDGTLPHPLRLSAERSVEVGRDSAVTCPREASADSSGQEESVLEDATLRAAAAGAAQPRTAPAAKNAGAPPAGDADLDWFQNMGNKTMFCQDIHRRIAEFRRGGPSFSALLLRVDSSAAIARTHGEPAWNAVLAAVAQSTRGRLRKMDLMAWYDDGTFGMVLPEASLRDAVCIGERLRKDMQQNCVALDDRTIQFTVSLGIVAVEDGDEMATLVKRAREELEKAQKSGGNRTGFSASALLAAS